MTSAHSMNVYCLPFAGGSSYSYRNMSTYAPAALRMIAIDLPGRGTRAREHLLTNIHDMVDDVFAQVKNDLHKPYALYGHSMGTLLGYLLTKKIVSLGLSLPSHLFFSGSGAPSIRGRGLLRHLLPRKEFIRTLKEIGGSPSEIFEDETLMTFFEPVLRADFRATETYQYQETKPFSIPITSMIGLEEKTTYEQARAWCVETTEEVEVLQFPGNHFFIFDCEKELVEIMHQKLWCICS
jgi:surfactin synthase thioesterase subunit